MILVRTKRVIIPIKTAYTAGDMTNFVFLNSQILIASDGVPMISAPRVYPRAIMVNRWLAGTRLCFQWCIGAAKQTPMATKIVLTIADVMRVAPERSEKRGMYKIIPDMSPKSIIFSFEYFCARKPKSGSRNKSRTRSPVLMLVAFVFVIELTRGKKPFMSVIAM